MMRRKMMYALAVVLRQDDKQNLKKNLCLSCRHCGEPEPKEKKMPTTKFNTNPLRMHQISCRK